MLPSALAEGCANPPSVRRPAMPAPLVTPTPRPVPLQGGAAGRHSSFLVPVLRDPIPFQPHSEMEPGDALIQHKRSLHWVREGSDSTRPRRQRQFEEEEEEEPSSESFQSMVAEARARSQRIHTDSMDTDGTNKFVEWKVAQPFVRDLCLDSGMFGFEKGDKAALTAEALSAVLELEGRAYDHCIILGKAWAKDSLEVKFHADGQIVDVSAEHLRKINRTEAMALEHRSKLNRAGQMVLSRSASLTNIPPASGISRYGHSVECGFSAASRRISRGSQAALLLTELPV
ncbi:unnamed protein product [Prorocentrum cordatum]|uniref:Uncharacterized protein n=1 Tax=Prorocentrum cordatum TaxID=2364126 RepID=A0ABN9T5X6_9DINO|nr:unnamed protein product [Polarella glacialis]